MNLSFTKIKNIGLPKFGAKLSKLVKSPKVSNKKISTLKSPKNKIQKTINFSKFTKLTKLPKSPKVVALKKAVKKAKNVGF